MGRRAVHEGPMHVRVHIRGTLNQAAFVAREPKSSAAGARAGALARHREVGESVPEAPFFARSGRALIFALFLLFG
jgi:hypothetical protein